MNLNYESCLQLKPFTIQKDRNHYILECIDHGEFYEIPEPGIETIKLINEGVSLKQVEIIIKSNFPDEKIDIIEFVHQLISLDLISKIDGESLAVPNNALTRKGGFSWIKPSYSGYLFNRFTPKLLYIFIVLNISIFFIFPDLIPHYRDLFVFDFLMGNIALWATISIVIVLFHELGHILAIRAHGLPTKIEIGHRLMLIVLETDLSHAWKLAPENRNLLYLGGIYFDNIVLFCTLTFIINSNNPLINGILGIVVLDIVIKLIYQLCFFMKTDLYYIIENVSGSYSLLENGQKYLKNRIPFLYSDNPIQMYDGESKTIRNYAIFYITGILLTLCIYIFYYIPQFFYAFKTVIPGFSSQFNSLRFWDAILFTLLIIIFLSLLIYSWSKKYIHKQ